MSLSLKNASKKIAAAMAAFAAFSSSPVFADASFTPDAAATWVARSLLLARIAGDDGKSDSATIGANMAAACKGLQSEQISHEYGKAPQWAMGAQMNICYAYDRWSGKTFSSKRPCDDVQRAIKLMGSADPAKDPADVISAVNALLATAQNLLDATTDHKRACRF